MDIPTTLYENISVEQLKEQRIRISKTQKRNIPSRKINLIESGKHQTN